MKAYEMKLIQAMYEKRMNYLITPNCGVVEMSLVVRYMRYSVCFLRQYRTLRGERACALR